MRYRLDLVLKPAEGALTRVLGMAERRGFTPHSINGGTADEYGGWRLQLVVDGQRPAETLRLQMLKVYDCVSVEITPVEITPVQAVPTDRLVSETVS